MEEEGPFDSTVNEEPPQGRDRTAVIIVAITIALGLVLLVLVLPPVSIFDDGDDNRPIGAVSSVIEEEVPPPPDGFEAVSLLYDLSVPESDQPPGEPALSVPLSSAADGGERLSFFSYEGDKWRRVGDATANSNGTFAQGELAVLPKNIAVFRATSSARIMLGSLPAGAEPHAQALDILTTLNPGGFAPSADGGITENGARLPSDAPVPVAPTISARAAPEIEALNAILASPELRTEHVRSILRFARDGGFAGIDLDYRSIEAARESEFVAFIQDLSAGLKQDERSLSLTLPLPVRSDGEWDTLGFDWETLAPLAGAIKLAPEPDGDRYYERTEAALAYLTSRIGSGNLLLMVGPLSRERGIDGVRTLTLKEALTVAGAPVSEHQGPVVPEASVQALGQNLAAEKGGSGMAWDESARAVVFSYAGLGGERTVWIANIFSEAFKLDLARRYALGGVAVEDVSVRAGEANIWPALREFADTGEVSLSMPNGNLLQPSWTATAGALESNAGPEVTWRAPAEPGAYTLTLIVSDGVMRVGQQIQFAVEAAQDAVAP